ncbi:hypothetical protein [Streptomyces sp. cmx-4-9]|uniref:hypothetical protein n=1 Tax=Streptomyces sp. cmx-4-9 TaxID=2790941 RepID=UPI0039813E73
MTAFHRQARWASCAAATLLFSVGLVALPSSAQASATGCDPWPLPPVRVLCASVGGGGTYVDKVDFHAPLSSFTCGAKGAIRFYDTAGALYHQETRQTANGCSWGDGFAIHPRKNMRKGKVCAVQLVNSAQRAGVCHKIT